MTFRSPCLTSPVESVKSIILISIDNVTFNCHGADDVRAPYDADAGGLTLCESTQSAAHPQRDQGERSQLLITGVYSSKITIENSPL